MCYTGPMKRFLVGVVLFVTTLLPLGGVVRAQEWKGYDAEVVSIDGPETLEVGQTGIVTVTFKNKGRAAWSPTGAAFVSLYQWDPNTKQERSSAFSHGSWERSDRVSRPSVTIKSGEVWKTTFSIATPTTAGNYAQYFVLAAEDVAWMRGSSFSLPIRVTTPPAAPVASAVVPSVNGEWKARILERGGQSIVLNAQDDVKLRFVYRNESDFGWNGLNIPQLRPVGESGAPRKSAFVHPTWNGDMVASMNPASTSIGFDATWNIWLRAPKDAGTFQERFALFTPQGRMIPGTEIVMPITVLPALTFIGTAPVEGATTVSSSVPAPNLPTIAPSASAAIMGTSVSELQLLGNGRQLVQIYLKNKGKVRWTTLYAKFVAISPTIQKQSWLQDDSWYDSTRTNDVNLSVEPEGEMTFGMYIKAPPKKGSYRLRFQLYANRSALEGGTFDLPLNVLTDGYIEAGKPTPVPAPTPGTPTASSQPSIVAAPLNGDFSTLPEEPKIRVGLYKSTNDQLAVKPQVNAQVMLDEAVICQVPSGNVVTISYDRTVSLYRLSGSGCTGEATRPYVVRAADDMGPLEIDQFVRPSDWMTNATDRVFRRQLELRFSTSLKESWVINELPVESYLKGIAETSNISPQEFQRTLIVAARTYAMYHVSRQTKHAAKGFTVDATNDQVYRGYMVEMRAPNIAAAVDATRGQIVTYQGRLAITPYFSRSDGRTRSWGEVWAGGENWPWLVSVPVPWDQGRTLWGHGVGMSASGALGMANDGRKYDEILRYFYTGIELRRAFR